MTASHETAGVLATCDPESEAFALEEMRAMFPDLPAPVWLDDGIALYRPATDFDAFAAVVACRQPLFLRHLAPVQREVTLQANLSDVATLADAVEDLASFLEPSRTFAVQSRILGEGPLPYRKFTLNNALSERLAARTGAVMECRAPEQIVSVLCTPTTGYLGVSRAEQNRSLWPGGEHRFKREDAQISRAEFKLLEAIQLFQLSLPEQGTALDLGAAPGGWTRVLRARGLRVVAVDPAELDARLRRDKGVTHIRRRVQDYLPGRGPFDIVVNDMRMDALDSVEVMLQARSCLAAGGLGIITLKLPHAVGRAHYDTLAGVHRALERLEQGYILLGARQLYHNRSEVTVALQAKPER